MIRLEILRHISDKYGTFSNLTLPSFNWQRTAMELPWANNEPQHSCVPAGTYIARLRQSTKWSPRADQQLYELHDVPERSAILIHAATWAGDVREGLKADLLGCVAPGSRIARLRPEGYPDDQKCIVESRKTLTELMELTQGEELQVVIGWELGAEPQRGVA